MRSFLGLVTLHALIFLWVMVIVRVHFGRDPLVFGHNAAIETIGYPVFYLLPLISPVGLAWIWREAPREGSRKPGGRDRTAAMYVAWFTGVVLGFLVSGLDLAMVGWVVFPQVLIASLIVFPLACLTSVAVWFKEPGEKLFRSGWPRVRIRDLMAVIAYLALLFGLAETTARLGSRAHSYQLKYNTCQRLIFTYKEMSMRTPAVAANCRVLIEHFMTIAAKYDRARKRPWIDVPPDASFPGSNEPALLVPQ